MFQEISDALSSSHWVGGMLMAFVMSVLRIIYDKQETSVMRILLESLICGALTIASGSALDALGYGQEWYLFCGGFIGFMGSQFIRKLAQKLVMRKIDEE